MYIHIHTTNNIKQYIYIYTHIFTLIMMGSGTPSPPTKSFPTTSPRVKLSGRPPVKFNGHENFHPL